MNLTMGTELRGTMCRRLRDYILACAMVCGLIAGWPAQVFAQSSETAKTESQQAVRDGQHDFDFYTGTWRQHLRRLEHPLASSNKWVEYDGTVFVRKVWDGRANLNEFEADGPSGHIEGLTLRLYNPQSHQWSLYWANAKDGTVVAPQIGEFRNGLGEFYGTDTLNGKVILIRFIWSNTTTNTPHFEQSFSTDGGKTWEVNWITDQTRVSEASEKASGQQDSGTATTGTQEAASDGASDFGPLIGSWKFQVKRLQ